MPHAHPIIKPDDLVTLRFTVPSHMVTSAASDVFIRTSSEGVIRSRRLWWRRVRIAVLWSSKLGYPVMSRLPLGASVRSCSG